MCSEFRIKGVSCVGSFFFSSLLFGAYKIGPTTRQGIVLALCVSLVLGWTIVKWLA